MVSSGCEGGAGGVQTDAMPRQFFLDFLNRGLNHEFKLVTAGLFLTRAGEWFGASLLSSETKKLQGNKPGWEQDPSTGLNYCSRNLEPAGVLEKGQVFSNSTRWGPRYIEAYRCNTENQQTALAMVGETAEWGLTYPDLSTQVVLGGSVSPSELKSPELAWNIYRQIIAYPNRSLSAQDIFNALLEANPGYQYEPVTRRISELDNLGLIDYRTTQDADYDPVVRITDPEFNHKSHNFALVRPETRAIYETMQSLFSQGISVINTKGLIEACLQTNPAIDAYTLNAIFTMARSENSTYLPGLTLLDNHGIEEGKSSSVVLSEETAEPIADLTTRLNNLANGVGLPEAVEKALKIMGSKKAIRKLTAKAKHFSAAFSASEAEGGHEKNVKLVTTKARALGICSIAEVQAGLREDDITVSTQTIRTILDNLVKKGEFEGLLVPKAPPRKRTIKKYREVTETPVKSSASVGIL
jgi:hypothetical protein